MPEAQYKRGAVGFAALAVLLVLSSHALPAWLRSMAERFEWSILDRFGTVNFEMLCFLAFSAVLVCHDPIGYGIRPGHVRDKWGRLALLCILPIVMTAIVYPQLPSKPFAGAPVSFWLISPLAQDLLFAGYLYRWFSFYFPGASHWKIPISKGIVLTALCFSFWHTPNIAYGIGSFIWFQLAYTFAGAILMGVIREWTGSLVYITVVHMAVNWIAVNM